MSVSVDAATAAIEVNRQLDEYERLVEEDKAMLRTVVASIIKYLMSVDHCYTQSFPWWMVGVDPSNRYGDGLDPERVHKLILAILNSGWAWEEVLNAVAREIGPDEKECRDMNVTLAKDSDEMLATLKPENLKVVTLSCGHTNAGLGCIGFGAKCYNDDLKAICHEGRFSLAKLRELKPQHADAVEKGLPFKVIRYEVIKRCPRLASYVQEAYNMGHSVAQQESCFQVVRKIHSDGAKYQHAKKLVPWNSIAKRVGATRPLHTPHVDGYTAFVQKHVDSDGAMLRRIGAYLKRVPAKASIRGPLFKSIAEVVGTPEYIEALVLTLYHPGKAAFVKNGWSSVLATPDISKLDSSLAPRVKQATQLLVDARSALEKVDAHDATKLLGDFGRELVLHVHCKSKEYATMQEVAWWFWGQVLDTPKVDVKLAPPESFGKQAKVASGAKPSAVSSQSNMRALTEAGEVDMVCELARRGFTVGCTVVAGATDAAGKPTPTTIVAIQKAKVVLGNGQSINHSVFLQTYHVTKAVDEITLASVGDAGSSGWLRSTKPEPS